MPLNKQSGNMYSFVTHTWNPIRGRCPHQCSYCYMKSRPVGELRLDEKCLKDNLKENNFIFVGSSTDMFADAVPTEWIKKVLEHCRRSPENTYLFQSKNPNGFYGLEFPEKTILGTTMETDIDSLIDKFSSAPSLVHRNMGLQRTRRKGIKKMISIEPIMDFDAERLIRIIKNMPSLIFVSVGADSKGHNLPEPSPEKVRQLITELRIFTKVIIKENLKRLL